MGLINAAYGFASYAHRHQKRKYTGESYVLHPLAVSETLALEGFRDEVVAAALLHDVIEDCEVSYWHLKDIFGQDVAGLVVEVSDKSKPSDGNRVARKKIDREHLASSSYEGASIKLADLMDNTSSIVQHDKKFAVKYLEEKALVLPLLRHGNRILWNRAHEILVDAQKSLVQDNLKKKGR